MTIDTQRLRELAHKQRDYMLFEDADGCDLCAAEIRARGDK